MKERVTVMILSPLFQLEVIYLISKYCSIM